LRWIETIAFAAIGCLALTGCYTKLKHAEPQVVYAEEEPVEEDPHAGLEIVTPPLVVSVDRPSYWMSQGDPVVVTIENVGDDPAILEGRGDLPDVYLEEWIEGGWQFSGVLHHQDQPYRQHPDYPGTYPQYPDSRAPSTPPLLSPRSETSHVFLFDRWGRFRVGVKQLTGDSSADLIIRSEPFEVWQ
jgi:hypothetical protein